jgi:hypothetical protein
MQFDPQTYSFVQNRSTLLGRSTIFDLFFMLRIGDAHIAITCNNVLNAQYLLGPVYPMPGRSFRLGVNWVFMD